MIMKVHIANTENRPRTIQIVETKVPIKIESPSGEIYRINFNNFGELEIIACDGKLSVLPSTSNMINIKTV